MGKLALCPRVACSAHYRLEPKWRGWASRPRAAWRIPIYFFGLLGGFLPRGVQFLDSTCSHRCTASITLPADNILATRYQYHLHFIRAHTSAPYTCAYLLQASYTFPLFFSGMTHLVTYFINSRGIKLFQSKIPGHQNCITYYSTIHHNVSFYSEL